MSETQHPTEDVAQHATTLVRQAYTTRPEFIENEWWHTTAPTGQGWVLCTCGWASETTPVGSLQAAADGHMGVAHHQ